MNVFVVSIPNEIERKIICEFELDLKNIFVGVLICRSEIRYRFWRPGPKTGVENYIF